MDNISVIIRNKNEERYIGYAIQSVLDNFQDPEIIVVDNNSTDNSLGIVNTFDFEDIKIHDIDTYTPGKSLNQISVKTMTTLPSKKACQPMVLPNVMTPSECIIILELSAL